MVTVLPEIVATSALLLLKVNAPGPLLLGAVKVNAASPSALVIAGNAPRVGPSEPPQATRNSVSKKANGRRNFDFMGYPRVVGEIAR